MNKRVRHCRLCQKAIDAACNARLLFRLDALAVGGPLAHHPAAPALERGFCAHCGPTLFSIGAARGVAGITAGSLADPLAAFRPEMHIWVSSRRPWIALDDGLPAFPEAAPPVPQASAVSSPPAAPSST